MKKIFPSLLLIALVVVSVTASAFALFSSTARVNGLTFSTGNADLQISTDASTWSTTVSLPSLYENMAPGFTSSQDLYLKNVSQSNIGLGIFTKLVDSSPTANQTAWGVIGSKINVSFQKLVGSTWTDIASGTLSNWKDTGFALDSLAFNNSQNYRLLVSLNGVENSDASQSLSGLSFQFVGTQLL